MFFHICAGLAGLFEMVSINANIFFSIHPGGSGGSSRRQVLTIIITFSFLRGASGGALRGSWFHFGHSGRYDCYGLEVLAEPFRFMYSELKKYGKLPRNGNNRDENPQG